MMFYLTIVPYGSTLLRLPHYAFSTICAVWNSQTYIDIWLHHKLGGSQLCARPTCDQPLGMIIIQQQCSYLPAYEKWFYPFSTTQALASNSPQDLDAMLADDDKVNFLSATILSMMINRKGLSQSQTFYLYSLIGCNKSDEPATISQTLRKVMLEHHPDKCQGGDQSLACDALSSSKSVLCDPFYRCVYDAYGDQLLEHQHLGVVSDVCQYIRSSKGVLQKKGGQNSDSATPAVQAAPASTFATIPLLLNSSSHTAPASTLVSHATPMTPH